MKLQVIFQFKAEEEFQRACDWYENLKPNLSLLFIANVRKVLERICNDPESNSIVFPEIRRAALRRFPFGVFYRILPNNIEVIALLHNSRDPKAGEEIK